MCICDQNYVLFSSSVSQCVPILLFLFVYLSLLATQLCKPHSFYVTKCNNTFLRSSTATLMFVFCWNVQESVGFVSFEEDWMFHVSAENCLGLIALALSGFNFEETHIQCASLFVNACHKQTWGFYLLRHKENIAYFKKVPVVSNGCWINCQYFHYINANDMLFFFFFLHVHTL